MLLLSSVFTILLNIFTLSTDTYSPRPLGGEGQGGEGLLWNAPTPFNVPSLPEAKPYTRWWWLGSAVDKEGLTYNLEEMARVGIGGVEITPIYGVKGNDSNEIDYLSPRWMQMLSHVESEGARLGIETNMATGTGWPFGGPLVPKEEAASKAIIKTADGRDALKEHISTGKLTLTVGRTGQQVKRAAPGGAGFVIDHFDKDAVAHYLARFDTAFANQKVAAPKNFFNDSYEVYGADWTPRLFEEFKARRGYDLAKHLGSLTKADSLRTDQDKRILSDYRETLGDLLYENFTTQWTDWAHRHGSLTRNQAHGSPANLLDLYAAVDIPECEGFGLSDFGIKGLRTDSGFTKKNFSDISMLKYASSGAHLSGHNLVSSETFTWLTEHFRTSLSQCKPDFDLFMVSGINHVFFHGACYSPKGEEWPGWRFYASVDMSPNNNWWSAMPAFSKYIERSQSMMQWGKPDNDVLVYLPFYDMIYEQPGTVALFDIHSMEKRAPKFIATVQSIIASGYDVDYISDRYLQKDDVTSRYAAIIVPDVRFMPLATAKRLLSLAKSNYKVIFMKHWPESVPGFGKKKEQKEFARVLKSLKTAATLADDYTTALQSTSARPEPMRSAQGLSCIRRSNDTGYHYFISNLQSKDVDGYVQLGVEAQAAVFYNPMNGEVTRAQINAEGKVHVSLLSGESIILRTYNNPSTGSGQALNEALASLPSHRYYQSLPLGEVRWGSWTLSFPQAAPQPIDRTWTLDAPCSWTSLGDSTLNITMATGKYSTTFTLDSSFFPTSTDSNSLAPSGGYRSACPTLPKEERVGERGSLILDLGDVRETAHVIVNGKDCGTLFAVPYRMDIASYCQPGENTLEVEVCNLPANRIADLDRRGVEWRKFKEINVVDLNYKRDLYSNWTPVPSGLCSEVRLIPATVK